MGSFGNVTIYNKKTGMCLKLDIMFHLKLLLKPIQNKRWLAIGKKLYKKIQERASEWGVSYDKALQVIANLAFSSVLKEIEKEQALTPSELRRELKKRMNKIVTQDLLGMDWQKKEKEEQKALIKYYLNNKKKYTSIEDIENKLFCEELLKKLKNRLSPRENEVLELHLQDYKEKVIAKKLNINPATVSYHIKNIKEKAKDIEI